LGQTKGENAARKIKCPRTLALIDLIIDNSNPQEPVSDYFPGDDLFSISARRKGLPMGNLTSQFFANLYLSPFDHFVKEELGIKGYIRYVDDFVLFHDDKKRLHEMKQECQRFLAERLRLFLHPKKSAIFPTSTGVTFLGQRIFLTHRRLKRENVQRFYRRLKLRLALYHERKLSPDKLECQLNSWLGHAGQADYSISRYARVLAAAEEVPEGAAEKGGECGGGAVGGGLGGAGVNSPLPSQGEGVPSLGKRGGAQKCLTGNHHFFKYYCSSKFCINRTLSPAGKRV